VIDAVVVDERAAPATAGAEALGQHRDQSCEILPGERAIGPSAPDERIELVLGPLARGHFGHDLLRQHVERLLENRQPIELAARGAVEKGGAFHQIVAGEREQAPFWRAGDGMSRTPYPLQQARDRARRTELAHEIDLADIDAELERSGCHQRLELAVLEPLLRIETQLLGEAAVVRRHVLGADPVGELARHPLRHPPGVDEDERGAMRLDQRGEALIDLLPDLGRHHRFERRIRDFECKVARAAVAGVDDGAVGGHIVGRARAEEKARHGLDGLLRGREADAQQSPAAERVEALERQREVGAALVGGERVDLIDDDGAGGREHGATRLRPEQDVERFRRGHHDMRRAAAHAVAFAAAGIARSYPGADLHLRQALRLQSLADAGERRFQVTMDVVRERLERRDIDDLGLVLEGARKPLPHQVVDCGEERRERLARPGRGRDQHIPARLQRRPRLRLRRRGRGEGAIKPDGDGRMKQGCWRHDTGSCGGRRDDDTGGARPNGRRSPVRLPRFLERRILGLGDGESIAGTEQG
jgi:hypothetical protein